MGKDIELYVGYLDKNPGNRLPFLDVLAMIDIPMPPKGLLLKHYQIIFDDPQLTLKDFNDWTQKIDKHMKKKRPAILLDITRKSHPFETLDTLGQPKTVARYINILEKNRQKIPQEIKQAYTIAIEILKFYLDGDSTEIDTCDRVLIEKLVKMPQSKFVKLIQDLYEYQLLITNRKLKRPYKLALRALRFFPLEGLNSNKYDDWDEPLTYHDIDEMMKMLKHFCHNSYCYLAFHILKLINKIHPHNKSKLVVVPYFY